MVSPCTLVESQKKHPDREGPLAPTLNKIFENPLPKECIAKKHQVARMTTRKHPKHLPNKNLKTSAAPETERKCASRTQFTIRPTDDSAENSKTGWLAGFGLLVLHRGLWCFSLMLFWGATIAQKLSTKIRNKLQKGPQRLWRLAASFPKNSWALWPTRPNCTLKRLPEKKRRGNQNERETTPHKTENIGKYAQIKARKRLTIKMREKNVKLV